MHTPACLRRLERRLGVYVVGTDAVSCTPTHLHIYTPAHVHIHTSAPKTPFQTSESQWKCSCECLYIPPRVSGAWKGGWVCTLSALLCAAVSCCALLCGALCYSRHCLRAAVIAVFIPTRTSSAPKRLCKYTYTDGHWKEKERKERLDV